MGWGNENVEVTYTKKSTTLLWGITMGMLIGIAISQAITIMMLMVVGKFN